MADQQDRPDQPSEATPPAADSAAPDQQRPAKEAAKKAIKKAPAKKAAKKALPKKAPAKAAKVTKAAKKAPPKKAAPPPEPDPTPASPPEPPIVAEPVGAATLSSTNGEGQLSAAANQAAAQAKSAVDAAGDSLTGPVPLSSSVVAARLPAVVAIAFALVAILVIRRLARS